MLHPKVLTFARLSTFYTAASLLSLLHDITRICQHDPSQPGTATGSHGAPVLGVGWIIVLLDIHLVQLQHRYNSACCHASACLEWMARSSEGSKSRQCTFQLWPLRPSIQWGWWGRYHDASSWPMVSWCSMEIDRDLEESPKFETQPFWNAKPQLP